LRHLVTNNVKMATSDIIRNTFVSGLLRYLLATLVYFVYLRSVVDSCSTESNNDSNCDLESTDNRYFRSTNRIGWCRQWPWYRQYWNSILASIESESLQCGTVFFCSLLNLSLFNTYCFTCFPMHSNCIMTSQLNVVERLLSGDGGSE